mmetsp:Transcript_40023/g.104976  ORF Transcript_40023/g.104976 Transcript_40023/m.104976 type:complete len:107 (-) Transcript_40023:33-353(-)
MGMMKMIESAVVSRGSERRPIAAAVSLGFGQQMLGFALLRLSGRSGTGTEHHGSVTIAEAAPRLRPPGYVGKVCSFWDRKRHDERLDPCQKKRVGHGVFAASILNS